MKISENTYLVIPIYDDEGVVCAYAHSTPISYEVFDANYRIIGKTYTAILENGGTGFMDITGPKTAAIAMREAGRAMGEQPGQHDSAPALMAEIRRLTTVIAPQEGDAGWTPIPLDVAAQRGVLTVPDVREVESAIVFFIVCWHMLPRLLRYNLCRATLGWGGQTSLLNVTEFIASLQTSKKEENTGETVLAS